MLRSTKQLLAVGFGVVMATGVVPATALTLTFSDPSAAATTLYYKYNGLNGNFLAAEITLDLTAITSSSATFSVTVRNTSSTSGDARLGGFGIDNIAPDVSSVITNNGAGVAADWTADSGNMPSGWNSVEFCATVGNNCSGGGGDGIGEGVTDSFTWVLTDAPASPDFGNPLSISFISPMPVRFQALPESTFYGLGSTQFTTSIAFDTCGTTPCNGGGGGGSGGGNAPEPGTIALSGLALLGMAYARRRQRP